jgi:AsmA protein
MKALKYLLIGAGGLLVLAIVAVAIFAMTFDPNRYKGQIEAAVKEKTGRTLKLEGDLKVAVFPSLGADVAKVTLSERASNEGFVSLDSAHASVALLPLLHGEVIVDRIKVAGLKANIVKGKDGKFNFDDLMQAKDAKPVPDKDAKKDESKSSGPVKFDIAGLSVERSSIAYKDLASGQQLELSDVKIATGRVAEKASGKLELAVTAKGSNPAIDMKVSLNGNYAVDLPAKSFAFAKVDGSAQGTLDKDALEAKISAPRLEINADKATGEAVTADFKLKGAQRSTEAALKLGGVQGSAKALVLPSISAQISLSGPDMPKPLKLDVSGSARADLEKQTASADLTSKVDESTIQSKLELAKFSPPAYVFDINVDRLNLDQYFPPKPKGAAKAPAGKEGEKSESSKAEDTPIDLSALKDLNANGKLQFGALQVKGLKLANLKAEIKAANGRLDVGPHSANLYEGALTGALSVQANGNRIALKESLTNVSVGPLLRDAAQQDRLEGRGNVALDVGGAGATVNTLKKSLDGTAKVNLKDGAIKGIDIGALLNKVKSLGGKPDEGSANSKDETKFTELNATFTIKNGVAHNQDFEAKAPLFRIAGAGDIDIGNSSLDYTVKASVVATTKGQGGAERDQLAGLTVPVKLSGPFDAMKYRVDYSAAATELAKSKVGERAKEAIEKNKDKVGDQVRDRLKGLLGR